MGNNFIAHVRKQDNQSQDLWKHLKETSIIAEQLAKKIGLGEAGKIIGLVHDIGKASQEFQNYILSATGLIDPDRDEYVDAVAKKGKVDHSTAGAQVIYENLHSGDSEGYISAQILSLCAASHHSGLIDCLSPSGDDTFDSRINKQDKLTHKKEAVTNLELAGNIRFTDLPWKKSADQLIDKLKAIKESNDSKETMAFKSGLLVRYLLSCLLDADRLNTADFENPDNTALRNYGQYPAWETLIQRLQAKLNTFKGKEGRNKVDEIRDQVSQICLESSTKDKGIFQLTVPTGGGKTLASLRFALNHAAHHSMDRIFYIIPYTSIIDQNADEVRKILEDKDEDGRLLDQIVLEHHSNLTPEEETRRQNLLSENWDVPIVFTTQVHFLESLFGNGTRSTRRMHQLANSVIVFDEVQTVPVRCIHMFNVALRFLVKGCGATVVLCTATQPLLDKIDPPQRSLPIRAEYKIIQDAKPLFAQLKRVEVFDHRKIGGWGTEEIAELAEQEQNVSGSVLIVVNTKNSARDLYQKISARQCTETYHLSTNMCPAHRLNVLDEIKEKLLNKQPVICVSTQLIEAGVDIDFGSVIRYLAGLDSIAQAAGRCNRHGLRNSGNVWIINPREESIGKLKDIQLGIAISERLLDDFNQHPGAYDSSRLSLSLMEDYYQYYFYRRKDEMKFNVGERSLAGRDDDLFNLLSLNTLSVGNYQRVTGTLPRMLFKQSFLSAAKSFYVIDAPTRGVIVPYGDEGRKIISDLCGKFEIERQRELLKRAQRYTVNLFSHEFKAMRDYGAIHEVKKDAGIFHLDPQYYNNDTGWSDEKTNGAEDLII
ncbi:MAG: CRISPR-associated helicase Cas3' [Anaerolineae bacterium]|nr:CRISPR-associated helicase Cas3' [Anaerolineae bacterium]